MVPVRASWHHAGAEHFGATHTAFQMKDYTLRSNARFPRPASILTFGMTAALAACSSPGAQTSLPSTSPLAFSASAGSATHSAYKFVTLDDNADPTFNQLLGIDNNGEIAGYFGSGASGHPNKGYTLVSPYGQGNYTNENYPGSAQTQVTALNNLGDTAGFWVDSNGNNFGFVEWNNVFTSYKNPKTGSGTVNQILGINDAGIAVGFYTDGNGVNHGFSLNQATGKFKALVPPNGVSVSATGINQNGDICGFATTASGTTVSWLLKGKSFTSFSYPGSNNTTALGINANDEIVGAYVDASGGMHGFTLTSPLNNAKFTSVDDPKGVGTTTINGLNDAGTLVGFYVDSVGNTDGFLATKK